MFQEAGDDLASRVRAASAAGFTKAEMFWTHDKDLDALAAALDETGIQLWTVLVDPRTTGSSTRTATRGSSTLCAAPRRMLSASAARTSSSDPAPPCRT